jgi:ADP-ribose pyrophosphatase YjhB (NUDIX family)
VRELREETGLEARDPRLAAVVSELDGGRAEAWLMFAVRAEVDSDVVVSDDREGVCRWVLLPEVGKLPVPAADPYILREVLSEDPGVAFLSVRFHDGELQDVEVARSC